MASEFERMLESDRDLACPKCLGNGTLATRTANKFGDQIVHQHSIRECEACDGTGINGMKPR